MLAMTSHQFIDLPQIHMDEQRYNAWEAEHYYMPTYKQQDVHFNTNDGLYFDGLDNGTVSMPPMERFMHDQYPMPHGMLHAKFTFEHQLARQYEQWPSADCRRKASPDRTSDSSGSNGTHNELRSPHIFRAVPYGSPTDAFSQSSLPYPSTEHFQDCGYLPSPPHVGGSVNMRQLEYEHHELESEPAMEDVETSNLKEEAVCNHEHTVVKIDSNSPDSLREYADSGIGDSARDAEEVIPIDDIPEDYDSDYSPTSSRSGKRRRSSTSSGSPVKISKRQTSISKSSATKVTKKPRRTSSAAKKHIEIDDDRRPFPCPLAAYGCISTFSSKNEWKRHVSTQHIKLGFWRCDLCPPTTDPNDNQTFYYNDFNRKDLFTQHLRRMHAAPKDSSNSRLPKGFSVNEENLPDHQARCLQSLRTPPQQSVCLFCDKTFAGPSSWEERMEHVGRHLEKDRNGSVDMLDVQSWNKDEGLEQYLLSEGLVVKEHGTWKVGDGKPRRRFDDDSEDDSAED